MARVFRLMALLSLVASLMAVSAATTQAEPGAHWNVNGSPITNALKVQGQGAIENNHGILLTKVGLSKVEILCTSGQEVDALLEELGGGKGKIRVEGCVTKLNGSIASACVPHSPGAVNGTIETNTVDALIKLHTTAVGSKVDLVELLPSTGTAFVTLVLGKAAPEKNECAIGEKFDISGKAFVKDCQEEGLVEKVTHLIEEGPLTALLFGANPAKIDGSATLSLAGPHAGMTVSGTAN
jgi:hypothetical protein